MATVAPSTVVCMARAMWAIGSGEGTHSRSTHSRSTTPQGAAAPTEHETHRAGQRAHAKRGQARSAPTTELTETRGSDERLNGPAGRASTRQNDGGCERSGVHHEQATARCSSKSDDRSDDDRKTAGHLRQGATMLGRRDDDAENDERRRNQACVRPHAVLLQACVFQSP